MMKACADDGSQGMQISFQTITLEDAKEGEP